MCVFIRSDISFNVRNELFHESIEAVWVDILLPKCKPILLAACYRPPTHNDFFTLIEGILDEYDLLTNELYLLGDLNVNVL